jgi:replication factor A1
MELEEIVNQILSSRSNVKREEILQMIKNKKRKARNFLTDETAARIIASELEVGITKKPLCFKIQIKDLVSGLNDVSLTGQVVSIYPPKTFKRRDWTEGKLASIIISDNSGSLRAVLWDNKVDLIEKGRIQQKQTVSIEHGYTRQGRDGKPEIHIGEKGRIKNLTNTTKNLRK